MRRGVAEALLTLAASAVFAAILVKPISLSAQVLPSAQIQPPAQALPAIVPLPSPPPLPKERGPATQSAVGSPPTGDALSITPTTPVVVIPGAAGRPNVPPGTSLLPGQDTATAFDIAQRSTVERINGYFNSIVTLVGSFVQVGPDGARTQGEFYLQKPGKVRFDYDPPSPVELISDGSSVVVRDRNLATQDLYPLSQTPLRFLLADKIDLLKDTRVVGVYQDDIFITVVIEESHAIVGKHRLMIMFGAQDALLKQWTVTDPQGYDTTVAIYNLNQTQKPDPSLFKINYERMLQ
jgi:outer membrane lipoprotein-sorting protein